MQRKLLWSIFGCKVGQSVQIGMKLELDVWRHPLDVYAKFQTDISKRIQKSPENFSLAGSSSNPPPPPPPLSSEFCPPEGQKFPNHDNDQWGSRHNISVCTKSETSIWFLRALMQINDFELFLALK